MNRFALVFSLCLSFTGISAFAGQLVSLPLTQDKAQSGTRSCQYVKEINMGRIGALKPFQVYSYFEGAYRLVTRPISLVQNEDSTYTLRLFSYQEVKASEVCPAHVDQMVLQ